MPFLFEEKRTKLSKEEFAEFLLQWLAMSVNTKAIKRAANAWGTEGENKQEASNSPELFGMKLSDKNEYSILVQELISLNLWFIARACERVFKDTAIRDDCLDIFHHLVFDRLMDEDEKFDQWNRDLIRKYAEYSEAVDTDMMALTKLIQNNLHGEVLPDAFSQFQIGVYVSSSIEAVEGLIKEYKVKK